MNDAEFAELLLLKKTCNDCTHIFWLLDDPEFDCPYTWERKSGSHRHDPALLGKEPICEKFAAFEPWKEMPGQGEDDSIQQK